MMETKSSRTRQWWLLSAVLIGIGLAWEAGAEVRQQVVWKAGEDGYHTYRIPAIIQAADGSLLAFCEGRKGGRGDAGNIDLLLKRSIDQGKTWGRAERIWDDGGNTCGNPCPVLDQDTGTLWLLLTHNLGKDHERDIVAGTGKGTRTVWVTSSRDHGVTWNVPHEITSTTKDPTWSWYATGPGVGIQLQTGANAGRLVVPCDHKELGSEGHYSHVIYSDDHGLTWQRGQRTPEDQNNECQVVELSDGRLVLNMRHYDRSRMTRSLSYSEDGGETWSGNYFQASLIEPICQASLIGVGALEQRLQLFSNPASQSKRVRMTVRLSEDAGRSWPHALELHEGPSAYSSLCDLGDGKLACLYERGDQSSYETITLALFDLEDVR